MTNPDHYTAQATATTTSGRPWWAFAALAAAAVTLIGSIIGLSRDTDLGFSSPDDPALLDRTMVFGHAITMIPVLLVVVSLLVENRTGRRWALMAAAAWSLSVVLAAVDMQLRQY